jgi:hypothetical protein
MPTVPMVHKPTVGMTIAIVIVLFIIYHFTLGKKK